MINKILPNQIYIKREQNFKGSAHLSKQTLDTSYKSIKTNSADYIKHCYSLFKSWCHNVVEVNVESGRLLDIAKSNEPNIFIMNHTYNPMKDIETAKFFNTLLYREYIYQGKAEKCPRSKVLANKNILKAQPDKGILYRWLGVTPITAHVTGEKTAKNHSIIDNLVKNLSFGKINLFLFPEGAFCMFPFLPMNFKFQPGTASIVKKVLELKDKIKVIPIGIAHNKKLSSAHISEPIEFFKDKDCYIAVQGENKIKLTENGQPVESKDIVPYISGVLLNGLKNAKQNAKKDLKASKERVYTL